MTRLLAQLFENRIEQRVFEFLRDDRAFQIQETTGETKPFKVAVVIAGDDHTALWSGAARSFLKILPLDVPREIFPCQARAPQQIDHSPREMLK